MHRHNFAALGISVLLHLGLPALIFFSGSQAATPPTVKTLPVSLTMFKPAPTPPPVVVEPVVVAKVEPPPKPKPKVKAKPKPKPKVKPKPKPKPKVKPKPKPKPKPKVKPKPEPEPEPIIEPIVEQEIEPPIEYQEPPIEYQAPQVAVVTPAPAPVTAVPPVTANPPAQPDFDPGKLALIEASYQTRLRQLIESKKKYPRRAKRLGHQGKVYVSFVVLPDGTIEQVELKEGSGANILDHAAMKTIISLSGTLPFPDEIKRQRWIFTIPISYELL